MTPLRVGARGGFGGAVAGEGGLVLGTPNTGDPKGLGICLTLQAYLTSLVLSCLSLIGANVFRTYACSSSVKAFKATCARGLNFHFFRKEAFGSVEGLIDVGQGLGGDAFEEVVLCGNVNENIGGTFGFLPGPLWLLDSVAFFLILLFVLCVVFMITCNYQSNACRHSNQIVVSVSSLSWYPPLKKPTIL